MNSGTVKQWEKYNIDLGQEYSNVSTFSKLICSVRLIIE